MLLGRMKDKNIVCVGPLLFYVHATLIHDYDDDGCLVLLRHSPIFPSFPSVLTKTKLCMMNIY